MFEYFLFLINIYIKNIVNYKPFVEVETFNDFKTLKLSVDNTNSIYITYENDVQTFGTPDVLYGQFVFIKDSGIIYLKGHFFTDKEFMLSSEYEISSSYGDDLLLQSGDTFEEAFGKIEKTIIDNELTTSRALNDLNSKVNNNITQETKSDWDEDDSTSYSYILNKPDLSNFITQETKSNWNETNTSSAAYIQNKPDLSNFITQHQSIKTINNQTITGEGNVNISGLPSVTTSDNGKILIVVNGEWQLITPSTVYNGTELPNNSSGNNGDLYVQTNE